VHVLASFVPLLLAAGCWLLSALLCSCATRPPRLPTGRASLGRSRRPGQAL